MRSAYVYILTSQYRGTLYIGVTSNIKRRIFEHKQMIKEGFTKRYEVTRLVYVEKFDSISSAIWREEKLKVWKRSWKIALIEKQNPEWRDLTFDLLNEFTE